MSLIKKAFFPSASIQDSLDKVPRPPDVVEHYMDSSHSIMLEESPIVQVNENLLQAGNITYRTNMSSMRQEDPNPKHKTIRRIITKQVRFCDD